MTYDRWAVLRACLIGAGYGCFLGSFVLIFQWQLLTAAVAFWILDILASRRKP